MARKRKGQDVGTWQRRLGGSDHFQQVYDDLLDSPAFHDLTPRQKILYLYCLRETYGMATRDNAPKGGKGDGRLFYMNRHLRTEEHELYANSDTRGFERDMAALIGHGFVDCMRSGYATRTKSLYRMSNRWNLWDTPDFNMPDSAKSTHMRFQKNPAAQQDDILPTGRM